MAIIQQGSFDDTPVTFEGNALTKSVQKLNKISLVKQAARSVQDKPLVIHRSNDKRGIALKSITLEKDFEGFIEKLFNPIDDLNRNHLYFVAWVWDLSGKPPVLYPSPDQEGKFDPQQCIFSINPGRPRFFGGAGINLFDKQKIVGGINIRMQIWESDAKTIDFGKTMTEVANTVKNSQLSNLLNLISLASGGITVATTNLIAQASAELSSYVGKVLQATSDDYVDFFEGYYPLSYSWETGEEIIEEGYASKLRFTKL